MTEIQDLEYGKEVVVNLADMVIRGIVVGKATTGITQAYIIQCIDRQLPNETYKYNTFMVQYQFIS